MPGRREYSVPRGTYLLVITQEASAKNLTEKDAEMPIKLVGQKCTQNARGTVVATEATTFLSWNVVGIGRLLHLLFCVLCLLSRSLSQCVCGCAVRERFARS